MIGLVLSLIATPATYLPCTVGLEVEFDDGTKQTVLGRGRRNLCEIEVVSKSGAKDVRLIEILEDRVLAAGYRGAMVALRPPLLMAPVKVGTKWSFKGADFEIVAVASCRVAKTKTTCATVEMRGPNVSRKTVYAAGVGLVSTEYDGGTMRAISVRKNQTRPRP